jgi:hypothetical protein
LRTKRAAEWDDVFGSNLRSAFRVSRSAAASGGSRNGKYRHARPIVPQPPTIRSRFPGGGESRTKSRQSTESLIEGISSSPRPFHALRAAILPRFAGKDELLHRNLSLEIKHSSAGDADAVAV